MAGLPQRLAAWRDGRGADEAQAICPTDGWAFRPRYTDGACPLCGWQPPGVIVRLPLSQRIHALGWSTIALAVVSLVMLVIVIEAYARA